MFIMVRTSGNHTSEKFTRVGLYVIVNGLLNSNNHDNFSNKNIQHCQNTRLLTNSTDDYNLTL